MANSAFLRILGFLKALFLQNPTGNVLRSFRLCFADIPSMTVPFHHQKKLGQHFLQDEHIAKSIVNELEAQGANAIVEIGPGQGALTHWLVSAHSCPLYVVEKDRRLIPFLRSKYHTGNVAVIHDDFLTWALPKEVAIIGNLPYNISSPILFKLLSERTKVREVVCMLQNEVATRIASPAGTKNYGILSVLLQAFFHVEYRLRVPPEAFLPPPNVVSGVVRLIRRGTALPCDEKAFFHIVKASFSQRRKMLRNALACLNKPLDDLPTSLLQKRAEALHVQDFVALTHKLYP